MCIITHSHLANLGHHVQPILSTKPFSSLQDGDFYDPIGQQLCDCKENVDVELPPPTSGEEEETNNFRCNLHNCCARYRNFSMCPWYLSTLHPLLLSYRQRAASREVFLRHAPAIWEHLEYICPNRVITNQYVHTALPSQGSPATPLPVFPSVEMFYLPRLATDADPEQCRRVRDAYEEVSRTGHRLWCARVDLAAVAWQADDFLFDIKLARKAGDVYPTDARIVQEAFKHLETLQLWEKDVRVSYCEFLEALCVALALVGRLPEPGVPFIMGDGSFSISAEQLGECDLSADEQEKAWNGPLLQSVNFWERFSKMTDCLI